MNGLHKLYLVEGLPGVDKATYTSALKDELENQGKTVIFYKEGDLHPVDMAWSAYLTMEEFNEFIENILMIWEKNKTIEKEELLDRIQKEMCYEDSHVIIAYTKLHFPDKCYDCLYEDLAARVIYDGRLPLQEFTLLLLKRWRHFSKQALNTTNTVYIFECAFLQNQIFELMGFYDMEDNDIINYLADLIGTVSALNPKLIYLEPYDIDCLIDDPAKDWMQHMIYYVEKSNYGRIHGLKGTNGVQQFLSNRYRLDQLALDLLPSFVSSLSVSRQ
ncbi:MAG: hypothetical protein Q4F05_17950 [bacterium]|nr:hypothetical protein [bacterium]